MCDITNPNQYQTPSAAGDDNLWTRNVMCTMLLDTDHTVDDQCARTGTTKITLDEGEKRIEEYDLEGLVNLSNNAHVDLEHRYGIFVFFVTKCAEVGFYKGLRHLLANAHGYYSDAVAKCQSGHVPCNNLYNGLTCGPDRRKDHYKCLMELKKYHKRRFPDGIVH